MMGVPAHDERDREFAELANISFEAVVDHDTQTLINSGPFSGLPIKEAQAEIMKVAERDQVGSITTQFRLRDWLVSRQRYWGAPIPIVYCSQCPHPVPVPDDQLPVLLPPLSSSSSSSSSCSHHGHDHEEDDDSPRNSNTLLADLSDWINTTCPSFVLLLLLSPSQFDGWTQGLMD